MARQTYRMNVPTLAIHMMEDGRGNPIVVPGDFVAIEGELIGGVWPVNVNWDDVAVMIFTADIRDRGKFQSKEALKALLAHRRRDFC
jgi:hypothetical protein